MKLIDHVLKIRGLIQQAIDNRFSRLGLQEEAMPVETLSDDREPHGHGCFVRELHSGRKTEEASL